MKDNKKKKTLSYKLFSVAVIILIIAICFAWVLDDRLDREKRWMPEEPRIDLNQLLMDEGITATDLLEGGQEKSVVLKPDQYQILLQQTGLGKPAVDVLLNAGLEKALAELTGYQDRIYEKPLQICRSIGIITSEERLVDDGLQIARGNKIVTLEDGDVLITKATHSIGWRHGHAAIVVDAENRITMEAAIWGENTSFQSVKKWESYPTLIQLRFKGSEETRKAAAEYAMNYLDEVPYGLLTGLPVKKMKQDNIEKTQCAHVVWYPYWTLGYDLDSDGGWLVTPKDLANSELFEVVQVYGANPLNVWP